VDIDQGSLISMPGGSVLRLVRGIDNEGLIAIGDPGTGGGAELVIFPSDENHESNFEANGKILLKNAGSSIEFSESLGGPSSVVNGSGHTIQGAGKINARDRFFELRNLGMIIANGQVDENGNRTPGELVISVGGSLPLRFWLLVNEGKITAGGTGNKLIIQGADLELKGSASVEVKPGAELDFSDFSVSAGNFTSAPFSDIRNNGTMKPRKFFNKGTLTGDGNNIGDVLTEKPGVTDPDNSAGTLTVVDDYEQSGLLKIELG